MQERIASLEAEERTIRRSGQGGGLLFPSAQLTEVQRAWNTTVLRLNWVEDQLGIRRSYTPIERVPVIHFPPNLHPVGVVLFVIGFLACCLALFIAQGTYIFIGILLIVAGYGFISARAQR